MKNGHRLRTQSKAMLYFIARITEIDPLLGGLSLFLGDGHFFDMMKLLAGKTVTFPTREQMCEIVRTASELDSTRSGSDAKYLKALLRRRTPAIGLTVFLAYCTSVYNTSSKMYEAVCRYINKRSVKAGPLVDIYSLVIKDTEQRLAVINEIVKIVDKI